MDEIKYIDADRSPVDPKYLDAVLTIQMDCVFNGTPEETVKWLETNECQKTWQVYRGETKCAYSVPAYLSYHYEQRAAKKLEKQAKITEIVTRAMAAQAKATYHTDSMGELDIVAKNAADEIVKLFD
ncbi:hypothetical protein SEA_CRICKO_79 [Streptomyces phage CricKo]|nr:hypothetical protein SEA_RAINYDAI_76 [Streptomyces phage Rainydai]QJD49962.1 hypothetical protein SEA_CRICKO_79 [Streptomyces phage CricKo]QNL30694.1 hypothetical protein SEA_THIQQUMS_79 [Streptomyces phage Thiqqums]